MTESQRGRLNLLKRKEKDGKIVDSPSKQYIYIYIIDFTMNSIVFTMV